MGIYGLSVMISMVRAGTFSFTCPLHASGMIALIFQCKLKFTPVLAFGYLCFGFHMTMKATAFLNVSRAQKQVSLTMWFSNEGYIGN